MKCLKVVIRILRFCDIFHPEGGTSWMPARDSADTGAIYNPPKWCRKATGSKKARRAHSQEALVRLLHVSESRYVSAIYHAHYAFINGKLLVSQQPACKPSNPHLEAIAPAQQPAPKSLGLWTASWSYERPVDGTCSRKCWWMEAFVAGDVRSSILQHSGPVYAACDVQLVSFFFWTQDIPTVSRHQGNFMLQHVEQVDR